MVVLGASDRPHHAPSAAAQRGTQARLQAADTQCTPWPTPTPGVHARPCLPHLPAQMSAVGRAPHASTAANSDLAWGAGRRRDCPRGAQQADVQGFCPTAWLRDAWGPEPCPGGKQPIAGERRTPGPCRLGTRMPRPSGSSEACRVTPGAGPSALARPGRGWGPRRPPPQPCLSRSVFSRQAQWGRSPGKAHSVFQPSGAHM